MNTGQKRASYMLGERVSRNGMMFNDYMAEEMTLRDIAKKYNVCKSEIMRRVIDHQEVLQVLGIPVQRNVKRGKHRLEYD